MFKGGVFLNRTLFFEFNRSFPRNQLITQKDTQEVSGKELQQEMFLLSALNEFRLKSCPNGICLAIKHDQTLFGDQTFSHLDRA